MNQQEVSCAVCDVLEETCKKLGDKWFCTNLIEDLKKDKITEKKLTEKVIQKFGTDDFTKSWNKTIEDIENAD